MSDKQNETAQTQISACILSIRRTDFHAIIKTILRSDELNCTSCVNNIESNLNAREGIQKAKVYFNTGRIEMEYDADRVTDQNLVEAVRESG